MACNKMNKLHDGACEHCLRNLGENLVRIFSRARTEPEFRKKIFARINPLDRDRFVQMFGNIE
jgi:hypothetical protein